MAAFLESGLGGTAAAASAEKMTIRARMADLPEPIRRLLGRIRRARRGSFRLSVCTYVYAAIGVAGIVA
jgi:hypothetical protein